MIYGFDAAIFDMDGTLLDSMRFWRYTTLEYLLRHDLPVNPEALTRMIHVSSRRMLGSILADLGLPYDMPAAVRELESLMDRHYQSDIHLKPCVPEFLEHLYQRGIKLCLATATPKEIAARALGRHGLAHYFTLITDTYTYSMEKGDTAYFPTVAKELGVAPERCMVFEDALYAIRSAKQAGCQVCAVYDPSEERQDDVRELADIRIRNYQELL